MPPPATKEPTEEKSPYSVNKDLFDESTKIKNHLDLIDKRLKKMEDHRDSVSDSVYLKVKTDYETQREEVVGAFQAKCSEIESELTNLYKAQEEQQAELAKHEEVLEEVQFRHKLGEFSEKKYKDAASQQNKEIKKFRDVLDIIKGSVQQYEGILGKPFSPESQPAAHKEEIVEEEIEEVEYLETETREEPEYTPATGTPMVPPEEAKVSEDSLTDAQIPPIAEEEVPSEPEPIVEENLEEDLDSFLQTEGDYFGGEPSEKETEAEEPPAEEKAKVTAAEPLPVSTVKPDDDSISTILRDISLEDATGETEAKPSEEATGPSAKTEAALAEASLLVLEGDLEEPEFVLGENTSIGRSPSNDIVLKEPKVSRQHATINYRDGQYVIVDLKSSNGIFVNDEKLEESTLKDGDEIRIGSFKFQFNVL